MPKPPRFDFASLYRSTLGPLRGYLARMVGNRADAQDLAHDAYTRVFEAMDMQQVERPEAYLFTTARRLALNQIKRRHLSPLKESDGSKIIEFTPGDAPGVERVVMARQEWAQLEAAIAKLPLGCRTVLLLRKVEHLSHAQISVKLGIAVSTVEKQHARALRLLRTMLNRQGKADDNTQEDQGCVAGR
jgi:RNA polymerase sigma-70 factor (ECF subfamily)